MKTILIAGSKGGIGKTSLALSLGYCLAQNYKVCLYDTDPQGSLINFKDIIPLDIVNKPTKGYDVCIIDCPPYLTNKLPDLIAKSDFVLLPCRPNLFDTVAMKSIIALTQNKPCGIVLTQVQHRVNITDIINSLESYNIPILKHHMSHRVSYARIGMQNLFETDDVKAQKEILSIVLEIFSQI